MLRLITALITGARMNARKARERNVILHLETMEERDVPAYLVWTAGGNGVNWSDANNWTVFQNGQLTSTHRTPTSVDDLYFGELGGASASSTDDIDVTVNSITQGNTYSGSLTINANLTVSGSMTAYGAVELTETINAANIYLNGGSFTVASLTDVPVTTGLFDMTSGATFTITMVTNDVLTQDALTLDITTLTMGEGTTFDLSGDVTLNGTVGTSGTVSLSDVNAVTTLATLGYSQAAGELLLPGGSTLSAEGSSPVSLSGHTIISGDATVTADTVQIDGAGVLEVSDAAALTVNGDLELRSGTTKFDTINGTIDVTGNFSVFIGTLDMNVDAAGGSNTITVGGTAEINQDGTEGGSAPVLNLAGTATTPTTFSLITAGTGSGDFNTITADTTVQAHGFNNNTYQVTL